MEYKILCDGSNWQKALRSIQTKKSITTKSIQPQRFTNFLAKSDLGVMYYGNHQGQIILEAKA